MNILKEKPFEYMRRMENGSPFETETVKNWYIARAYVLEKLKDVAFKPDSNAHLHVVVNGDSPLMLSVARQVALSAHYLNFQEDNEDETCRNRTVITIVSRNPNIKEELMKEEFLCNLPKYCKYVNRNSKPENDDSFIDIEIHIVDECPEDNDNNMLFFSEEDVDAICKLKASEGIDIYSIDTRKAVYAHRIYSLGEVIDNLPAEDINCAKRYAMALDVFQHEKLKKKPQPIIDEKEWRNLNKVKEGLSNIFCTDCFESRKLGIQLCSNGDVRKEKELWEEYNIILSKSEHARWVVEKLIMGYSPLKEQQRFKDEGLFLDEKKKGQYRKSLKTLSKNPAHIDLCSYTNLRRINPNDLKYDSFMILAIPKILEKVTS